MRDKNAPHSAAIKETEVHDEKKMTQSEDGVGEKEKERERERMEEKQSNERTVLSLANAFPSTSSLLQGNTKNLTLPSSAPPIPSPSR